MQVDKNVPIKGFRIQRANSETKDFVIKIMNLLKEVGDSVEFDFNQNNIVDFRSNLKNERNRRKDGHWHVTRKVGKDKYRIWRTK